MGGTVFSTSGGAIYNIIALIVILIFALIGLKNGFAKSFLKFFGKIIAIILSLVLCSYCANFLQNTFGLIDKVGSWLSGILTKLFGDELMNTTIAQANSMDLSDSGISKFLLPIILKAIDSDIPSDTTLNQVISPVFGYYLICILSAIILFILFKILIKALSKFFTELQKFKLFGTTDRALGFVLGAIEGAVYIQIALMILQIIPIDAVKEFTNNALSATFVKFVYEFNIFKVILDGLANTKALELVSKLLNK